MKLAIMQPYFFPYLGYFQAISAVDKYILYENLDYITEGWMHRNRILIKYKKPAYIIINIQQKSSNKKIYEIKLDPRPSWRQKIIRSININYNKSKYYNDFFPIVENIISAQYETLHDFNCNCIAQICNYLEINTQLKIENKNYLELEEVLDCIDDGNYDFDVALYKTRPSKKTARVIEICKRENAETFINAIGGMELYSKEEFAEYHIELFFIKNKDFQYKQFAEGYFRDLSIIDTIMHCGKEKTQKLLNNYELI